MGEKKDGLPQLIKLFAARPPASVVVRRLMGAASSMLEMRSPRSVRSAGWLRCVQGGEQDTGQFTTTSLSDNSSISIVYYYFIHNLSVRMSSYK